MSKNDSARMMAVHAGASPPRTMAEFAIAMEGEAARRAFEHAFKPRPCGRDKEIPPLVMPPGPVKDEEPVDSWAVAVGLLFWLFVLAAVLGK